MALTQTELAFLQRLKSDRPVGRRAAQAALLLDGEAPPKPAAAAAAVKAVVPKPAPRSDAGLTDAVAVQVWSGRCCLKGKPLWSGPGGYHVVSVEQARETSAQRLLVVEHLVAFRHLERCRWIPADGGDVLAIFIGEPSLYKTADATAVLAARSEPVWCLPGFDPAGLALAARLPRLERLLLPPLEWLVKTAKRQRRDPHFKNAVEGHRGVLDSTDRPEIAAAWAALKQAGCGVSQRAMLDAAR